MRILREHLATFLGHTERTYAAPLPKYVVDTFEHDLTVRSPVPKVHWLTGRNGESGYRKTRAK
jgi:hypothetical protein